MSAPREPWIGVDLDGTLAEYHGWRDGTIGTPVPAMLARVRDWLDAGIEVRVMTARACSRNPNRDELIAGVQDWTEQHLGVRLEVTAEKDYGMIELWDDRAQRVEFNTGRVL